MSLAIPSRGDAIDATGTASPESIRSVRQDLVGLRKRVRGLRIKAEDRQRLGPGESVAQRKLASACQRLLKGRADLGPLLRSPLPLWEQLAGSRLSLQQARQATQLITRSTGDQVLRLCAALTDTNDRIEACVEDLTTDPQTPPETRTLLRILFSNGVLLQAGVADAEAYRKQSRARRQRRQGELLAASQEKSVATLRAERLGDALPTEAQVVAPRRTNKKTTTKGGI